MPGATYKAEFFHVWCEGVPFVHLVPLLKQAKPPPPPPQDQDQASKAKKKLKIVTLIIDAVSKQHFHRIYTKTLEVLDEMRLDANSPSSVYRFDHLTSQGPNTYTNMHGHTCGMTPPGESNRGELLKCAQGRYLWDVARNQSIPVAFANEYCVGNLTHGTRMAYPYTKAGGVSHNEGYTTGEDFDHLIGAKQMMDYCELANGGKAGVPVGGNNDMHGVYGSVHGSGNDKGVGCTPSNTTISGKLFRYVNVYWYTYLVRVVRVVLT